MKIRDRIKSLRRVKASELLPHPKNWRSHPPEQADAMRGVLAEIGYADALLVRKTPEGLQILDGHLRAEITPDEKVPVLVVDLNDEEADKLLATHDPLGAMAEANKDALGKLLHDIETDSEGVKAMLEGLAAENDINLFEGGAEDLQDPGPQINRAAELQKQWKTKRGQLWEIPGKAGVHRVLCGDCREAGDVGRVMGGVEIALVMADPPYGIGASCMTMGDKESSKPKQSRLSTGQTWDHIRPQVTHLLAVAPKVCIWGGQYFCKQLPISDDWLCWYKKISGVSFSECELAWTNYGRRCRAFVHHWSGEEKQHITQKPLAVLAWAIEMCPGNPATLYDLFLGSGTTLIAAEQLGRVCYGMEISPAYVAVILQRVKDAGLKPKLTTKRTKA